MSNPATTRLFDEWTQNTPANSLLKFTNETGVANYYGATSLEATMAGEYFSGPNAAGATMLFTRIGLGQRSHLLGANISSMTMTQLQAINGPIAITFNGLTYTGDINLAGVNSFSDAASEIETALRKALPMTARAVGGTIKTQTINFVGDLDASQLYVTSGPALVVGGKVFGAGINPPSTDSNQILYSHPGGHYSLFAGSGHVSTPEAMTETFSKWYPGTVTEGAIAPGQLLVSSSGDVPKITAVISGNDTDGWILNNAFNATGDFTTKATPLQVTFNHIVGQTEDHNWFSVQPNGAFGFDANPNTLSFMSGSVADALGLSQASGALDSTPGGQHPTMAQFMNQTVREADADGTPYTTFQDVNQGRFDKALSKWSTDPNHPGRPVFLPEHDSAPPAGSTGPMSANIIAAAELFSLPTIELNERGFDQSSLNPWGLAAASIGHGPASA